MAVPKRKTGKQRTHTRRSANWKMSGPTVVTCPQCKSKKLAHHVCNVCGFYNGENVLAKEEA